MVIDGSALLEILPGEPERRRFNEKIIDDRFGYEGARDLKLFLAEAAIAIEPVTLEQAEVARSLSAVRQGQPPRGVELR
jgi:uncharacterized protein with PIN domain